MGRQIRCPNCGGEHDLVNPGITMLVCSYCQTTVYWDDQALLKTGAQSILPESDARLFLFASGKLHGKGYQVVGHVRYDHGRGTWDEWYLALDGGGVAWLSEDERRLTQEMPAAIADTPERSALRAGSQVLVEGTQFTVREIGSATCVGAEGQLPFAVVPDERYTFADIASRDGTAFGTLEYDRQGDHPTCFIGQPLAHEQLSVEDERPAPQSSSGRHVQCENCAAPLETPPGRDVQTQVCAYCGAQLDLTGPQAQVLGVNPPDLDTGLFFPIGAKASFYGKSYEVCGRMLYEDAEGYRSREYLLFEVDAGYLWLAEENGHFVLSRPTQEAPAASPLALPPKTQVAVGGTLFRVYETGISRLIYVDGALPWLARCGDSFRYADLIAPPQVFSIESDNDELEYFHGRYVAADEVHAAFNSEPPAPRPFGVHGGQPFVRGPVAKLVLGFGLLFAVINLGLLGWSVSQSGRQVLAQSFAPSAYLKETVSRPFTVSGEPVMAMTIRAPLRNSWLSVDVGLVNADQQVVMEVAGEISYYSGYEGGERWTEGRTRDTSYFRAPPPGQYRLILKGSGGTGNYGSTPGREPLDIQIHQGAVLSSYFIVALLVTALFPLFELLRQYLFEKRRWANVIDDDDDDDAGDWD